MSDNILDALQKRIREQMNNIADAMIGGGCAGDTPEATGANYMKQVGVIEGLARAEREILDLKEAVDQGVDDE